MGIQTNTTPGSQTSAAAHQESIDLRVKPLEVRLADLDFSAAPTVRGIGYRFVIPVPNLGDENRVLEVKNWKGETERVVGYGFKNATDGAAQAVSGDGNGVIIVALNPEITDIHGATRAILDAVEQGGGAKILTVTKLDTLLDFIHNTLGLVDTYNSNDATALSMKPQAGFVKEGLRPLGLFEKQEKPGPRALNVEGYCSVLDGPHAGDATYPDGFMAVQLPPKKEGAEPTYRSIAPSAISYCYEFGDGKKIADNMGDLPVMRVH